MWGARFNGLLSGSSLPAAMASASAAAYGEIISTLSTQVGYIGERYDSETISADMPA